jgi:hypothetical protein
MASFPSGKNKPGGLRDYHSYNRLGGSAHLTENRQSRQPSQSRNTGNIQYMDRLPDFPQFRQFDGLPAREEFSWML